MKISNEEKLKWILEKLKIDMIFGNSISMRIDVPFESIYSKESGYEQISTPSDIIDEAILKEHNADVKNAYIIMEETEHVHSNYMPIYTTTSEEHARELVSKNQMNRYYIKTQME